MNLTLTSNSSTENGMRVFYGTLLAIFTLLVLVPCLLGMPRIGAIPNYPSADYVCYAVFVIGFTLKYGIVLSALADSILWSKTHVLILASVTAVTFPGCLAIVRWWLPPGLELWRDGWILCVLAALFSSALSLAATPITLKPGHSSA